MKYFWPVEEVGKLGEVNYSLRALGVMSDYTTEEINGEKYIKEAGGEVIQHIKLPADNKLIISLLEIVKEISPWDWAMLSVIVPFDNIKKWLLKYGLPGYDEELFYKHGTLYSLRLFEKHVITLFLMFKLYESIYFEKEEDIVKYWSILIKHPDFVKRSQNEYQEQQNKFIGKTLENKKASVLDLLGIIVNHEVENIQLRFLEYYRKFHLSTASVFSICYYQFGLMLSKNDKTVWKNIKKCANENCQTYFWAHGNRKYCDMCDRRTIWSKNNPKKKKVE